jgi:hypothetical protein
MSRHRRTRWKASRRPAIAITVPVPIWQHPGQSPQARAGSAELGTSGRGMSRTRQSAGGHPRRWRNSLPLRASIYAASRRRSLRSVFPGWPVPVRTGASLWCAPSVRSARCPGPPPDRNLGDHRRRPVPGVRPGLAAARFHGRPSQHLAGRRGAGQCRRADPSRTAVMDNPRVGPGRTVSPRPAGRAPPPGRQDGRRPGSRCRRLDQIVRAVRIAARGRVARSARKAQQ